MHEIGLKDPRFAIWATLAKEQINVEHHCLKQFVTGALELECSAILSTGETEEEEALECCSERSQLVQKEKTIP